MITIGESYYLDVYPAEMPWEPNDPNKIEYFYNAFFMVPAHTIVKVKAVTPQLMIGLTEDDKFKELLKEHPDAIEYKEIEDRIVLTSSTKDFRLLYSNILMMTDCSRIRLN